MRGWGQEQMGDIQMFPRKSFTADLCNQATAALYHVLRNRRRLEARGGNKYYDLTLAEMDQFLVVLGWLMPAAE